MEELDKNGVSLELSAAGVAADKMARANGAYEHPSKTEDKDVEKPRRDAGLASLQEESEVTTEEAEETKQKEQGKWRVQAGKST